MKKLVCFFLSIMLINNAVTMNVAASEAGSENKCLKEAEILVNDEDGKDYYRQFTRFDKPVFIILAENYLDNKPQFYLTNAWSNLLNEEYRRKGTFKNEYIYDMIIMGFLKYEVASDTYSDSLFNRTQDFATDLYSVLDNELDTVFEKSKISDSTMKFYHNKQTISDLGLAMDVVNYAEESYEIYLNVMASKMALLESNRDKLSLFRESVNIASNNKDKDYASAMNLIIDAMDTADPAGYLNQKTDVECSSFLLGVVEDVVKEINPIFQLLDLSVSGIDLVFNSSDNASNDIKLAYFFLADSYLRQGLISIVAKYINMSDPLNKTSENARAFIDSFKTYLLFQKFGNIYAEEWLDNFIRVRSTPIKKLFNKKKIQNALDMKQQCVNENGRIDKMLRDINELEKEEDVWKIIISDQSEKSSVETNGNGAYKQVINTLENEYGSLTLKIKDEYEDNIENITEVNGLCYLSLIDFNNDGVKELLAVVKHEEDPEYTVLVYTEENGQAVQLLSSTKLTDASGTGDYLCLKSDNNHHTYIDRRQWGGEWDYDEIYGYEKGEFKLISNSCRAYNFEKGDWDNYIVEEVPNVVDPMKLNRKLISKDEYEKKAPLATGASNTETNYICLAIPDTDIDRGNYYGFDFKALQDSIDKVKRELAGLDNGTADNNEAWRQSYIDYIETDPDITFNPEWCTCGLIYVDNDEIPELIIEYSSEADGTGIVSFKKGETTSYRFSRSGGISYYEREGTIRNSIGSMGLMRDQFASLDGDGFHDLGSGQRYDESGAYSNYTHFNWNGEEVSEEEYYANINWFDYGRAKEWNTYSEEFRNNNYLPNEMCEYLSNN